jgi:hypothetical protein
MVASRSLLNEGYFAPPILQLAVPKDKPRIRFFISATHTEAQLCGVVDALARVMDKTRFSRLRHCKLHHDTSRWGGENGLTMNLGATGMVAASSA